MYKKPFYINKSVGNNAFSYEKRNNKQLYVTNLIEIDDLEQIKLGNEIVFEDYDFNGNLSSNYGLKNFYKLICKNKDIYLFDNHNHAFYFWYLSRSQGVIGDENILIHIDEHSDTRDNNKYLNKPDSYDLNKVFDFTNYVLNVGDYIIPAKKEGIISEIIQIRNESNLLDYIRNGGIDKKYIKNGNIIFNLDLDFFQPDLDYIDYELKKKVILDILRNSSVITVSTSPFFINQELAIKVFKDIFGGFLTNKI